MSDSLQLDATPQPDASSLSLYDRFNRLRILRSQLLAIKLEIRRLAGTDGLDEPLPQCECLRCGWTWQPYNPFIPPMTCSRCGTTAWNKPPTKNSRKPSDPPSPRWRTPKRSRKKYFRVKLEGETWKRKGKLDAPSNIPKAVFEELKTEVEKLSRTPLGEVFSYPVPPRISALLPPPPSPSLPGSLASRLAFLRGEQPEPQPETVASHLPVKDENAGKITLKLITDAYAETVASHAQPLIENVAGDTEEAEIERSEVERQELADIAERERELEQDAAEENNER
jgi:hypothetical protein